jgi:hypothetical protein
VFLSPWSLSQFVLSSHNSWLTISFSLRELDISDEQPFFQRTANSSESEQRKRVLCNYVPRPQSLPHTTGMGTRHWEDYCEKYKDSDGKYILRCTWGSNTPRGDVCGYTSKKQLVKRHIETTHLKFKYVVTSIPDTDTRH